MDVAKIRIGQIDLRDLSSSELASANSVNLVQDNVTTLTATAAANDFATYNTVTVNTYNTYTTLDGRINTVQDNVSALDNNAWVNANDFSTYSTLSGLVNTVQANLTSLVSAAPSTLDTLAEIAAALENDANIAVTLTTAIGTVQSNVTTLTATAAANDFSTYSTLSGLIDTVQDNVASQSSNTQIYLGDTLYSNTALILEAGDGISLSGNTTSQTITLSTSMSNITSQVITADGSANSFTLIKEVANSNMIFVSYNGLLQDPLLYDISTTSGTSTLTLSNTDPLVSGDRIEVRYVDLFQFAGITSSGGGGGGGSQAQGSVSGYTSGGFSNPQTYRNTIDKFSFSTDGNATDVGDLTLSRDLGAGQSSTTSGYTSGGSNPSTSPTSQNIIDKFPFSSDGNASDVGDLTTFRSRLAGQSSTASGYSSGGIAPGTYNVIDKFPFSSDGNATDVGDLTQARYSLVGQSSSESGYTSGGFAVTNTIDKFPFSSDGNATDVGDLTQARGQIAGQSSSTSGYTSGGSLPGVTNTIDKFPFATDTNATDVGDLSQSRISVVGQSSSADGYTSGGKNAPSDSSMVNTIDKFPFSSDSNATDVGDLSQTRYSGAGQQV